MSEIFSDYTMKYLKDFYHSENNELIASTTSNSLACSLANSDTKGSFMCGKGRFFSCSLALEHSESICGSCCLSKKVKTFKDALDVIKTLYLNIINVTTNRSQAYDSFLSNIRVLFLNTGLIIETIVKRYSISFSIKTATNPKQELRSWDDKMRDLLYYHSYEGVEPAEDDEDEDRRYEIATPAEETLDEVRDRFKELFDTVNEIIS